jgi:hypothetical protein
MVTREPADPRPDPWRVAGMPGAAELLRRATSHSAGACWSRRAFLSASAMGAFGLVACGPQRTEVVLPAADWREPPPARGASAVAAAPAARPAAAEQAVSNKADTALPDAALPDAALPDAALPWAKPRVLWARGGPNRLELNPMLPVTCVTIHHDGLDDLIWSADSASVAERIERYRVGHRGRGWADIGYHLIIDRGGVLWQGRSIRWQGAHVQHHNEGNIGLLVMGNFELQSPTSAQLSTLRRVLVDLRATYQLPRGRVYTHREWDDAQTACPGRRLQPRVERIRQSILA